MSSAAQWVAAIGTAGATLLSGSALAARQMDRRRSAATRINAWLELGEQEPLIVTVANTSDTPIYELVAAAIFHPGMPRAATTARVVPPGKHQFDTGEVWDPDHYDALYPPTVWLLFHDSAGRNWERSSDGRLRRRRRPYRVVDEYFAILEQIDQSRPPDGD